MLVRATLAVAIKAEKVMNELAYSLFVIFCATYERG